MHSIGEYLSREAIRVWDRVDSEYFIVILSFLDSLFIFETSVLNLYKRLLKAIKISETAIKDKETGVS